MTLTIATGIAVTGASSPTLAVATTIALILAAVSPALLRYVKLDGPTMAAVSYLAALGIAIGAGLLTGDLSWSRDSVVVVLLGSGTLWAVQQSVYKILWPAASSIVGHLMHDPSPPAVRSPYK